MDNPKGEFISGCKRFVEKIENYSGNDPIDLWHRYLLWIELNFKLEYNSSSTYFGIVEVFLERFSDAEIFYQDRRLIKACMKYISCDDSETRKEAFDLLHSKGFGTKVADFYMNWSFLYDIEDDFVNADAIYKMAFVAKAEPRSVLQTAFSNYRNSRDERISEKIVNFWKKNENVQKRAIDRLSTLQLGEYEYNTRKILGDLISFDSVQLRAICVPRNVIPIEAVPPTPRSLSGIRDVMNTSQRKRMQRTRHNVEGRRLQFDEEQESPLKPIPLPPEQNMYAKGIDLSGVVYVPKNRPQDIVNYKPYIFEENYFSMVSERSRWPEFSSILLLPKPDLAFIPEESRAYRWFKNRNIVNSFTIEHDKYFGIGPNSITHNHAMLHKKNFPQPQYITPTIGRDWDELGTEEVWSYEFQKHYPKNLQGELSFEEILWRKRQTKAVTTSTNGVIHNVLSQNAGTGEKSTLQMNSKQEVFVDDGPTPRAINQMSAKAEPMKRKSLHSYYELNDTNVSTQIFDKFLKHAPISTPKVIKSQETESQPNKFNIHVDRTIIESDSAAKGTDADVSLQKENLIVQQPNQLSLEMDHNKTITNENVQNTAVNNPFQENQIQKKSDKDQPLNADVDMKHPIRKDLLRLKTEKPTSELDNDMELSFRLEPTKRNFRKPLGSNLNNSFQFSIPLINVDNTLDFEQMEKEVSSPAYLLDISRKISHNQSTSRQVNSPSILNITKTTAKNDVSIDSVEMDSFERIHVFRNKNKNDETHYVSPVDELSAGEDIGKSIYEIAPELEFHDEDANWAEVTAHNAADASIIKNEYKLEEVNLNETQLKLDTIMLNLKELSPFNMEFQKSLLEKIGFVDMLNDRDRFQCAMMNIVHPLKPKQKVSVAGHEFKVCKLIGSGSFGKVFSAEFLGNKEMYAFKQQRPPHLWEYYICAQVQNRIKDERILQGFMEIEFAIIGNNSTIYISKFAKHGTLLNVCNKVKTATGKSIDEIIVMLIVKQMLALISSLHEAKIIHADLKPDNFLLMKELPIHYGDPNIVIQLIDFGQSIDLTQFQPNMKFWHKVKTENFICTEMLNDKPWTFQFDLFCLASTIYTMVAGKYMVISRQKLSDPYKPQKLPRYVNASMWEQIFDTLINIPNAKQMPNLYDLELLLDAELKKIGNKKISDAVAKFNKALN